MNPLLRMTSFAVAGLLALTVSSAGGSAAHAEPSPAHDSALAECSDPLVPLLYANTGWRKRDLRMGWAIAMRESGGDEALLSGDDHGLYQLNSIGWADSGYWPADPFNGAGNAAAAYAIWQDHGWIPWGHNPDGSTATDHYQNWTKKQISQWITRPFRKYYKEFPSDCRAWLKQN